MGYLFTNLWRRALEQLGKDNKRDPIITHGTVGQELNRVTETVMSTELVEQKPVSARRKTPPVSCNATRDNNNNDRLTAFDPGQPG